MAEEQGYLGDPGREDCANCWRLEYLTWIVGAILSQPGHKIILDREALRTATMMDLNEVAIQVGVMVDEDGERKDTEPLELRFAVDQGLSASAPSCEHIDTE